MHLVARSGTASRRGAVPASRAGDRGDREAGRGQEVGDVVGADQVAGADRHEAAFADSLPSYQSLDRTRRHGSELWQPLLIGLLALLFLEVLLQQRIARG